MHEYRQAGALMSDGFRQDKAWSSRTPQHAASTRHPSVLRLRPTHTVHSPPTANIVCRIIWLHHSPSPPMFRSPLSNHTKNQSRQLALVIQALAAHRTRRRRLSRRQRDLACTRWRPGKDPCRCKIESSGWRLGGGGCWGRRMGGKPKRTSGRSAGLLEERPS
ncbi:hypothetical protein K523DRAFT_20501 [Schizophyllum commune Tattone D]|nr:hypothetical protein K523DRAFT_20501 [Schizophyllum commune Tattone D]